MSERDDFELWLGRIGDHGRGRGERFAGRVIRSANLARGGRAAAPSRRRFDGSRIGRGSGVGRLLGSSTRGYDPSLRRVMVKTSIVRLGARGRGRASAHLRYLQRDGTTREGERGLLYSADRDRADGKAFLERGSGDRHQFRFIVSAEDGSDYADLKPLTRRLMEQAERDLGTKLDWVAVDHFNTGHPHSHILVRGKDEAGKDLIIAREYLTQGLRERAAELVNLDLGPRTELEIARANLCEVEQERFTRLDRRLLRARDPDGLIDPRHRDTIEHDLRVARLRRLERMGLAEQAGAARWRVDPDLEPVLRRMGERGDIIRTLNRELRTALPERGAQDQAIFDPHRGSAGPIIGRLVATGLADEYADRRYLIVDATDGRSHYVDIGQLEIDAAPGAILSIGARPAEVRDVDRTIAEVAAANGGRYSIDLHLRHDRTATQAFAEAHVRRLEAIRRATKAVERTPDGRWIIEADHLDKAEAYERQLSSRAPVVVDMLSTRSIEQLADHDGATWLDRELAAGEPTRLERGFGAEVRKALDRRRQWLIAERLAELDGNSIRCRAGMIETLEKRELNRTAAILSRELGRPFTEAATGDYVGGRLSRMVRVGDKPFALIEKAHEFTLVPWRPVLERRLGQQIGGIVRESSISWTFGRSRGLGIP